MYHYTYKITYSTGKYYIGVRSSKCKPEQDTKYIGSSKYTPNDKVILKEILSEFKTRKEAVNDEIKLHNEFNVAESELYYNRSKQTSVGFDTTGTKLSKDHLEKVSKSLKGRKFTNEHKLKIKKALTGKKRPKEARENISKAKKGISTGAKSDETKRKISEANKGQTSHFKGKKFNNDTRLKMYSSRLKYPDKYNWINKKTDERQTKTCQEMGILYGTRRKSSSQFANIVNGKSKSYLGWKLNNENRG